MSRTACCFLALGISVAAFAAACGDDDDGGGGIGGNGGSGASGGSGGSSTAGSAGSAGTAGDAGSGGDAGAGAGGGGGTASGGAAGTGNGGTGGSAGGGSGGAAGSSEEPDGGAPDSGIVDEPDSGVVVVLDAGPTEPADSGVNGDCTGFTTGLVTASPQSGQDFIIARVIFDPDDDTAHVILRTTIAAPFADPQQLCSGPTDDECVAIDDEVVGARPAGTELRVDITGVTSDEGELAFMSGLPSDGDTFPVAYVNWGGFESVNPGGPIDDLETRAVASGSGFWTAGDSITVGNNDNAIFVSGETNAEDGFGSCTADQF